MVAEPIVWGDVEGAVRAWARAALPELDGRVFFGANNQAAMPQIVLFRVSGPDNEALIQFDVWANTIAQAQETASALATAAAKVRGYIHNGVQLKSAVVTGRSWQPDEESNLPRYIVGVTFAAWALVAP